MVFFDPVDPSTEGLLWPGGVGFCIVASGELSRGLPVGGLADAERQSVRELGHMPVRLGGNTGRGVTCRRAVRRRRIRERSSRVRRIDRCAGDELRPFGALRS